MIRNKRRKKKKQPKGGRKTSTRPTKSTSAITASTRTKSTSDLVSVRASTRAKSTSVRASTRAKSTRSKSTREQSATSTTQFLYVGMQSSMRLEKWFQIFDSYLDIKDMPPRMSPMFVLGSHTFAMFYAYVKNREYPSWTRILRWQPLPDLLKTALTGVCLHCMAQLCTQPYLYACNYTIWPDRAMEVIWNLLLLNVSAPLKKQR